MNLTERTQIQATAQTIAREAGEILLRFWHNGFAQTTKSTAVDVVTEADTAAEAHIVARLKAAFPDHHIVGEEGGGTGAPIETAAYRWYVDPLDGTTNYANRIPIFAVSLALCDSALNPLVGVVYNPFSDELFSATRDGGATLNGEPIRVTDKDSLRQCVLASGFPYDKAESPENNLREWGAFLVRSRGLRRLGSAALDCCFVAAGRFDGYWEQKLNLWDIAAGMLIATEAGATVSDYAGDWSAEYAAKGRLVLSNGRIHEQIIAVLRGCADQNAGQV